MKRREWIGILICVVLMTGVLSSAQAATEIPGIGPKSGLTSVVPQVLAGRSVWLGFRGHTSFKVGELASGGLSVGYQRRFLGAEARVTFGSTQYGAIRVLPNPAEVTEGFPSAEDPTSELGRSRSEKDKWSLFLIDPGVTVSGRLFVDWFPLFTQRARIGYSFGTMTDQANGIPFSAGIFNYEAGLQYQLGENSPWAADLSMSHGFGAVVRKDSPSRNLGRIPVSIVSFGAALIYWF